MSRTVRKPRRRTTRTTRVFESSYSQRGGIRGDRGSRQELGDDLTGHVGQAKVPALVSACQFFVIDPHEAKNRSVQIVNVHRVFGDIVPEIV